LVVVESGENSQKLDSLERFEQTKTYIIKFFYLIEENWNYCLFFWSGSRSPVFIKSKAA